MFPAFLGAAFAAVAGLLVSSSPAAEGRVFTVTDAIELPRLVAPGIPGGMAGDAALNSPQGSSAIVAVTRGDIVRDTNVLELWIFDSAEVREFAHVGSGDGPPSPGLLARIEDAGAAGQFLANLKWIGEGMIAFIARDPDGIRQVFTVTRSSRAWRQVTQSATDVLSFDIAAGSVLYYAKAPATGENSISIVHQNLQQLLTPENPYLVELWSASIEGGQKKRVDLPVMFLLDYFQRLWLSPDGKRAIIFVPAAGAPAHWARYRVPNYEVYGYTADRVRANYDSQDLALRTRYALVDLERNKIKPLLDAPSGHLSLNSSPVAVFWLPQADSVIVSNAFLPLDERAEETLRIRAPAVAEVNLRLGTVQPILFEPYRRAADGALTQPRIYSLGWDAQEQRITLQRDGVERVETYRRRGNRWLKESATQTTQTHRLILRQGMNERARLFVFAKACACEKLLFDPAPEAGAYSFGRVESLRWRDANGIEWHGGLIYPPDFSRKRPYPLVVQTHGFDESEFLIDGPGGITTAMAAQPLANAGMLVLQVEDNAQAAIPAEKAASQFAAGYRAGIDMLVKRGIVDSHKVGIIAFSSTGLPVIQLLAKEPELFAAATISDASWWGYLQELTLTNAVPDLAIQYLRRTGSDQQRTPSELFAADPLYRFATSRAAIRLEANGVNALVSTWEHYTVLRKASRPVEFMYHPRGEHVLTRPRERLASQGGAVDWFRFWLENEEDPDVSKTAQYVRWRSLRRSDGVEAAK